MNNAIIYFVLGSLIISNIVISIILVRLIKNQIHSVPVRFKRFDKNLPGFYREKEGNAGYDLFARIGDDFNRINKDLAVEVQYDENGVPYVVIQPWKLCKIPLNVAIEMPTDAVGFLSSRSSTFKNWKLQLVNCIGIIDSIFHGDNDEWIAQVRNESDTPIVLKYGDKIMQAIFLQLYQFNLTEVDSLGNKDRGGIGTSFNNILEK